MNSEDTKQMVVDLATDHNYKIQRKVDDGSKWHWILEYGGALIDVLWPKDKDMLFLQAGLGIGPQFQQDRKWFDALQDDVLFNNVRADIFFATLNLEVGVAFEYLREEKPWFRIMIGQEIPEPNPNDIIRIARAIANAVMLAKLALTARLGEIK